jgi:hypothetical protein
MYLVDLCFIDDGNPHVINVEWPEQRSVISWRYHYMTANAINHVRAMRSSSHVP